MPKVIGKTLKAAKSAIAKAHCRVGRIAYKVSSKKKKGRVLSQRPRPNAQLRSGGRVRVVVSKGRRR